jgi:L-seryl-tRNA(Ser) seleniumtransferase
MRTDKLTLAALQQVALVYLSGDATTIPLWRMATAPVAALRARAADIAAATHDAEIVDTEAVAGGGSLPGLTIPSVGIALQRPHVKASLAALRDRGIVARTEGDRILCDLRSVDPADDSLLARALAELA